MPNITTKKKLRAALAEKSFHLGSRALRIMEETLEEGTAEKKCKTVYAA